MTDLPTKLAQLEALRPTFGAAWVEAQIAALRAEESAAVVQKMEADTITGSSQTTVLGDQHIHAAPPDEQRARAERALLSYLRATGHSCNTVQLARIDPKEGRHHAEMRLEQVYIGLNTERQVELRADELRQPSAQQRRPEGATVPVTALEALDRPHPARLLLLGAPGSGKSTFVNHLALCLAGACLGTRDQAEAAHGAALLERLAPHWTRGALLPVRVVLRELAAFPALVNAATGSLALLHAFLTVALAPHSEALDLLVEALSAGRALLLFDGLDEVEAGPTLVRVTACIAAAAGVYKRSPVLVTCRVLDYQANPQRRLPGFQVETLAALDDAQIDAFIAAWHAEVAATGRAMLGDAAGLRQALASSADLRGMARQPLLLTMMAIVHAGKGKLPDARALLYSECIELLLLRWRKEPDAPDLLLQLGLPEFKESDLIKVMARIGFAAHNRSARDPNAEDRPADLSRNAVRDELDAAFTYYVADEERRAALVVRLLNAIATRNGLLLKQSGEGGELYSFPHRSFQEFLAGYHLSLQGDYDRLVWARAGQVAWHEALRLMVSYQALSQTPPGQTLQLIWALLAHGSPLEQTLAGELLALVGYARAAGYLAQWAGPAGWWAQACTTMRGVATAASATADARLRARAGMALGQLCYGSVAALAQPGAAPPAPDPRLLDPATGDAPDGHYWCAIEPGPFWYGDETEEEDDDTEEEDDDTEEEDDDTENDKHNKVADPLQQMALDYSFKLARFPVTNAEYARFIADGGYAREEWWTEEGWKFLQPGGHRFDDQAQRITLPRYWDDPEQNSPLQPVTGISWYEAAAYATWLTAQGHATGWLPMDSTIRLPTSLEWERAARHPDQRRYPWGDDAPTPERANYAATAIKLPSPVGCFPAGATVCGAEDLLGNVRQWMATPYKSPEQLAAEKDFAPETVVLQSYSDFGDDLERLSCGSRYRFFPNIRYGSLGIRLVWS